MISNIKYTQEKYTEGICSARSLRRIEKGTLGISPATFNAFMHIRFYLKSRQLDKAYDELQTIENKKYADNKIYYQQWFFFHCALQSMSYCCDHETVFGMLKEAINVTRPGIDIEDFTNLFLTSVEISILIAIEHEALYNNDINFELHRS